MTSKSVANLSLSANDPAVLFVTVGWADRYDGETTVVGTHRYLADGNGDDCSEMSMFARDEDGEYACGIGRGALRVSRLDVVFVAKRTLADPHRVVGVYFDAEFYDRAELGTWTWARTADALELVGAERAAIEWPKGQGMRRWATRAGGGGREHPELYAVYRRVLAEHGKQPGGVGRKAEHEEVLAPPTAEAALRSELQGDFGELAKHVAAAKDRSAEDLGGRTWHAQVLALDEHASSILGSSHELIAALRALFRHPELTGVSLTSFCANLPFAELTGLLALVDAKALPPEKIRVMFPPPDGCELEFAYWLHNKMQEGKLTAREYPHLGGRVMHVKLLVAHLSGGRDVAIIGSSNATFAGVASNEELNVAFSFEPGGPRDPLRRFDEAWEKNVPFLPHHFAVDTLPERKRRPLFDFQRYAIDRIEAGLGPLMEKPMLSPRDELSGRGGGLIVLPTGAGKTITAMRWIFERVLPKKRRVLWLTHRTELLAQAYDTALGEAAFVTGEAPKITFLGMDGRGAGLDDLKDSQLIFMSVQRAHAVIKKAGRARLPSFDVIVIDEAHRASTTRKQYTDVLCAIPHGARLGLTATPYRGQQSEGRNFAELFQLGAHARGSRATVLANFTVKTIEAMPLPGGAKLFAAAIHESVDTKFKLTVTATNEVEFSRELARFDVPRRNKVIVDTWCEKAAGQGASLIFCVSISHANHLAEMLNEHGHRAHAFHQGAATHGATEHAKLAGGSMNSFERARILEKFRRGDIEVLCCVQLLTEGFDLPGIGAVLLARPTMSTLLLMQMIGRGRRGPAVGGRDTVRIIDFADQLEIHSARDESERYRVAHVDDAQRAWRNERQHSEGLPADVE